MTDNFVNLHKWYERLQRTCADQEIVDEIMRRMKTESDQETVRSLAFILASEFRQHGRYGEAENILLDLSEQNPNEPYPLIKLAEQKLYYEEMPNEALAIVEKALSRARASGNFRRNALGVKARIAEKLQRHDLIADVLREIMTIKSGKSRADVGVERDFVDRLPTGAIDPTLLRQYDEFCRSRRAPS
jgi:tetratricopeptide (TPR) repeat protein